MGPMGQMGMGPMGMMPGMGGGMPVSHLSNGDELELTSREWASCLVCVLHSVVPLVL